MDELQKIATIVRFKRRINKVKTCHVANNKTFGYGGHFYVQNTKNNVRIFKFYRFAPKHLKQYLRTIYFFSMINL